MDLSEFIADTILQIQQGVSLAIERTADVKGAVNPVWGTNEDISEAHVREVTFDIAVTVSDTRSGKAGGEIKVVGIGIGGDRSRAEETSHVSRIQFSVPIIPAVQVVSRQIGPIAADR